MSISLNTHRLKSKKPYAIAAVFIVLITAGVIGFSSQLIAAQTNTLSIDNSWIRQAPPNAKVLAAYLELNNSTDKNRSLLKISSKQFEKIEIHRTVQKKGVAHMEQQHKVLIPAHQKVTFEPGGLHLMLIKPKKSLKSGDHVEMTFSFDNGSTIEVNVAVVKRKNEMDNNSSHQHHH